MLPAEKIGHVALSAPIIVGVMTRLSLHDANECAADILELRIDLLKDEERTVEKIKAFTAKLQKPLIVTNRRKEEGGAFAGTEAQRINLLTTILETATVNAVDVEFFSPDPGKSEVVTKAQSLRIPIIFSFHDFNSTPSRPELLQIVTGMYKEGGNIAKIAVTPRTLSDALLLLQLTHDLTQEEKFVVTIGMGPIGRHLRVITPLYGSVLTYGFIEGEAVAPGQLSVNELRSIMDRLGVKESFS
jgi:3-dehydroquinate dehydratase-1